MEHRNFVYRELRVEDDCHIIAKWMKLLIFVSWRAPTSSVDVPEDPWRKQRTHQVSGMNGVTGLLHPPVSALFLTAI